MTTPTDDGGAAFMPVLGADGVTILPALSKRDWFAGQAWEWSMREAVEWWEQHQNCNVFERAAKGAYMAADAMLAARKEQEPK